MTMDSVSIGNLTIDEKGPFFLIAGPCVIEDLETTMKVADFLRETGDLLDIPVIFKTSYDKANRTSLDSYRGPGIEKGLEIIRVVKEETGLSVLSDVHEISEIELAAKYLDVLQIPAFLCRQTNLLTSAGETGLPINIKKGQFLSPWGIEPAIRKVLSTGNRNILITERGTSFGYNNLIVDIRSIAIMKNFGFPVVFDATHSVQLPGSVGTSSGGQREFVAPLSRAAVAAGAHGVFMEVHPDPDAALCDGPNSLPFNQVRPLLAILKEVHGLLHPNGA
jgi:2-dehydro-3-deoxyphosphooctonate aldolase (KDO 8-P synthase)